MIYGKDTLAFCIAAKIPHGAKFTEALSENYTYASTDAVIDEVNRYYSAIARYVLTRISTNLPFLSDIQIDNALYTLSPENISNEESHLIFIDVDPRFCMPEDIQNVQMFITISNKYIDEIEALAMQVGFSGVTQRLQGCRVIFNTLQKYLEGRMES